MDFARST